MNEERTHSADNQKRSRTHGGPLFVGGSCCSVNIGIWGCVRFKLDVLYTGVGVSGQFGRKIVINQDRLFI